MKNLTDSRSARKPPSLTPTTRRHLTEIGLIGLATMGANLARNISNKGFPTVVFNRTSEKTEKYIAEFGNEKLIGAKTLKEFVNKIAKPRKIIIMVQAGDPVDQVIAQLTPLLDPEDLIIDCGNSNYKDTIRRATERKQFLGCGVSGGEEGALNGPSLMPGGTPSAYKKVEKILNKIAARDFQGNSCTTYIGDNGAGHYVKTVHNGIEYGVMQMIAEAYEIYRTIYKLPAPKIAEIFQSYNRGKLKSYLFEIAAKVLQEKDPFKKGYLIDSILDEAGQKGTGRWTAIDALQRATALPTITEAVFARITSGDKETRKKLSKIYKTPTRKKTTPLPQAIPLIRDALYAGMLSSYAQGFDLIQKAATEQNWQINLAEVSRIWEGGCIIRATILNTLHKAYGKNQKAPHLFAVKELAEQLKKDVPKLRKITAISAENAVAIPALSSALQYFEAMTSEKSSANMIQGLRDFFGAHTFQRIDKKGSFHNDWSN